MTEGSPLPGDRVEFVDQPDPKVFMQVGGVNLSTENTHPHDIERIRWLLRDHDIANNVIDWADHRILSVFVSTLGSLLTVRDLIDSLMEAEQPIDTEGDADSE